MNVSTAEGTFLKPAPPCIYVSPVQCISVFTQTDNDICRVKFSSSDPPALQASEARIAAPPSVEVEQPRPIFTPDLDETWPRLQAPPVIKTRHPKVPMVPSRHHLSIGELSHSCDLTVINTTRPQQPEGSKIDYSSIRLHCENNDSSIVIDASPEAFRYDRIDNWPSVSDVGMDKNLSNIYAQVKNTGVPNFMEAKAPLPTDLHLQAWEDILENNYDDQQLLSFITFGFPVGYLGPPSNTLGTPNHKSATDFPDQISLFIRKETKLGGLLGPFTRPPFKEWAHVSPLISREKKAQVERRVIPDMTYPRESSINAYIRKNSVVGEERDHSLPKVQELVNELIRVGPSAYMSSIDIKRAYKNFKSDPLDWPLLCLEWDTKFYCDITMPFGARASSCHMQRVADAIVAALHKLGIFSKMYLDDLVILSGSETKAHSDFKIARDLVASLGLPEALEKAQPPAPAVTWLGVIIDAPSMTVSIPETKLQEILKKVGSYIHKRSLTKRQLQSIIGALVHIAKCISPGRLFIGRLLDNLRGMKKYVNISSDMKKDFAWFLEFAKQWNGVACIPCTNYTKTIFLDACLSGIGATDGTTAYAHQVAPVDDGATNIAHLEAVNIPIALHTFISEADRGGHIHVYCDNEAVVSVLTTGKGKDRVLLDCARMCWMAQAMYNFNISYSHIAGSENEVADALSRAHLAQNISKKADLYVVRDKLNIIKPCTYAFDVISPHISSRSGLPILATPSSSPPEGGTSTRNQSKPEVISSPIPRLEPPHGTQPQRPLPPSTLRLPRVLGHSRFSPTDNKEQAVPCKDPLCLTGPAHHGVLPHQVKETLRRLGKGPDIQFQSQATRPHAHPQGRPHEDPTDARWPSSESSPTAPIFRRPQAI